MIPYKCPVCNGKGQVPSGFYNVHVPGVVFTSTTNVSETCRSCGGSGIIYGSSPAPYRPLPEIPRDTPYWYREPWGGYKIGCDTGSTSVNYNTTFGDEWVDGTVY